MPAESVPTEKLLAAAKRVFLARGYDGASMDEIAAAAETTKRTLYNHFPSKEKLFEAMADFVGGVGAANLSALETLAADPLEAVTQFCLRHLYWSCWADAIAMQRLVIALAPRFPKHAALFYERTMTRGASVLAAFVAEQFPAACVRHGSPRELAALLLQAVAGERRLAALMGATPPYPPPAGAAPCAGLPEEPAVRRVVAHFLVPGPGDDSV